MRICSLVPSATEIVCALGLSEELVGISHRCDYPSEVRGKPVVSQVLIRRPERADRVDGAVEAARAAEHPLYELDEALVRALAPDLILTQEVCEICAVPASLAEDVARGLVHEPRVLSVTARTVSEILSNIERLGVATGRGVKADALVASMRERVERVKRQTLKVAARPRVAFLEWIDPPWAAGNWVPELIDLAGGLDVLGAAGQRSRKLQWAEVWAGQAEVIFVAPCGFEIERTMAELRHLPDPEAWQDLPAVRHGRVFALDGTLWSRYGPRVVDGLEILARAIHPGLVPGPLPDWLIRPVPGAA